MLDPVFSIHFKDVKMVGAPAYPNGWCDYPLYQCFHLLTGRVLLMSVPELVGQIGFNMVGHVRIGFDTAGNVETIGRIGDGSYLLIDWIEIRSIL